MNFERHFEEGGFFIPQWIALRGLFPLLLKVMEEIVQCLHRVIKIWCLVNGTHF